MSDSIDEAGSGTTGEDRLAEVHERAMRRFDAIWTVEAPQRRECLEDRRIEAVTGAIYEGQGAPIDDDAEENGGPARLEIPTYLRPIRRIRGEYRASRKTVDFKPKGDDSERATANNLDGLYRADENDSPGGGQHAYANAFNEGSSGGMGGWWLKARYEDEEDEENEHQRIEIVTVYDADQSMWFYGAKAQDKSDAKAGFLLFTMLRDVFEEEHPDADPTTFTDRNRGWEFEWTRPDDLTLAMYWEVEDKSVTRITMRQTALDDVPLPDDAEPDEQTFDEDALSEKQESGVTKRSELQALGYRQVKKRRIKRQVVHKYLLSGAEVLEDEGLIAGPNIPLVPFYMERAYVDGIERIRGMIRPVKDAARLFNLAASNLGDAASGPTEKTPVMYREELDNVMLDDWSGRKVNRPAVLTRNMIHDNDGNPVVTPMQWVEPDQIQPATAAVLQIAGQAIDSLMGVNAQAETVPSNTSAAAIRLVNERGDVHDVLWEDNFGISIARSGQIWLGMARELYVEEGRKMVAVDGEGKQSTVELAQPKMDEGGQHRANDLSTGKYDVIVDVGPATKTRRDAVVKSSLEIAKLYGEVGNTDNANAFINLAAVNTEGEGMDQAREAVRKQLVQSGFAEPNEEEKAAMAAAEQDQQPDPNTVIAQAAMITANADLLSAQTKAAEAKTRNITALANLKVAEARAAAILATIPRDDAKQILAEVKAETDSDRADEQHDLAATKAATDSERADASHHLDVARATTDFERHDRDMSQPRETPNGNAD